MLPPLTHTADARTAGWRKVPRRILPRTSSVWRQPRRPRSRPPIPQRRMNVEASGGDAVPPAPQILHAARLVALLRRTSRHGISCTASSRMDQGAGGTAPSRVLGAPVRAKRLGLRWRSRAEPPLWAGCPDRRGAATFVATSGRRKRWQATRTPRPRGVRMGREKSRWRRGAPRRLFFASRQRVSVRIGPHRYAAPIRLRCRRTLGPP